MLRGVQRGQNLVWPPLAQHIRTVGHIVGCGMLVHSLSSAQENGRKTEAICVTTALTRFGPPHLCSQPWTNQPPNYSWIKHKRYVWKLFFVLHSLQRDHHSLAGCSDINSPAVHWSAVIASFDWADVRGHPLPSPYSSTLLPITYSSAVLLFCCQSPCC